MRIPSGSVDRKIGFVALDSSGNRITGLSSFTVYRSRNGGTTAAYTTPTITELSAANMPGDYVLLIDEDTTLDAGHDFEGYIVHVSASGMQRVTRELELERIKFTEGQSATMANSAVDADLERVQGSVVSTSVAQIGTRAVSVAPNAIDAAALAADVTTELQAGLATSASVATLQADTDDIQTKIGTPAGASVSADVAAIKAETASIQSDTNDIQARIPAALVGGRIAANAEVVGDKTGYALTSGDKDDIVDRAWDEPNAGHLAGGSTGKNLGDGVAVDPWTAPIPGAYGAGTAGKIVGDNLNATVSSRATSAEVAAVQSDTDNIQTRLPASLVAGRMDANAGVVGDKTGYELTTGEKNSIVDLVWDEDVDTSHQTAGTAGKKLDDASGGGGSDPWLTVLPGSYAAGTAGKILADANAAAANLQTRVPDSLIVGRMDCNAQVVADKSGYELAVDTVASVADAVWDEELADHAIVGSTGEKLTAAGAAGDPWSTSVPGAYAAGTAGKILGDNLNAQVSTRAAATALASVQADTDNIQTRLPTSLVAGKMDSNAAVVGDKAGYALTAADKNDIADRTWDEPIAGHLTVGTTGAKLESAGNPWATALPGAFGFGTAGKIVGDNLNAAVTTRATPAQVNAEVLDVLAVDTFAEPGLGVPPATSSIMQKISYVFKAWRNRITQDATTYKLYGDNATTVDQKAAVSDNGTVFDRGEVASGP